MSTLIYVLIAVLGTIDTYGGGNGQDWVLLIFFLYIIGEIDYLKSLMGK